ALRSRPRRWSQHRLMRRRQAAISLTGFPATSCRDRPVLARGSQVCRSQSGWPRASAGRFRNEGSAAYATVRTQAISQDQTPLKGAAPALPVGAAPSFTLLPETLMSIIAWMILGLIAGFIASKIVDRRGQGVVVDILLGIVGAVVGGWLFHAFGARGVTGLNLSSLAVASIGAIVVLFVYHALSGSSGFRRI